MTSFRYLFFAMLLAGQPALASIDSIASDPMFSLEAPVGHSGSLFSESIVQSAMDKFERCQWKNALVDLNSALEQRLGSPTTRGFLYCARGICYFELGLKKRAQRDLRRATAVAPNQPSNWYQRAEILLESGRLIEAWRCSNIAIKIDSQDSDLLLQRARIERARKRFEAAGRDLCAAVNARKTQCSF